VPSIADIQTDRTQLKIEAWQWIRAHVPKQKTIKPMPQPRIAEHMNLVSNIEKFFHLTSTAHQPRRKDKHQEPRLIHGTVFLELPPYTKQLSFGWSWNACRSIPLITSITDILTFSSWRRGTPKIRPGKRQKIACTIIGTPTAIRPGRRTTPNTAANTLNHVLTVLLVISHLYPHTQDNSLRSLD